MAKVFEKLLFDVIFEQVKSRIHRSQHGFYSKRSTLSTLMEYISTLSKNVANGGQIDSIYTDFWKTFDQVDHRLLIKKLKAFGLSVNLLAWFKSYLTDRTLFVVISGSLSQGFSPSSGVPQGSILRPLLFIMFINDLVFDLSSCSGLADDLKIYRIINDISDCILLQRDLTKVDAWCTRTKMTLNIRKCEVMSVTNRSIHKII